MPWVRIDDHFDEHPKHAAVGPLAWGVWLAGLAYSNRNLTDGFIPRSKARSFTTFETVDQQGRIWTLSRTCGMVGEDLDAQWVIDLLLDADLWDEVPGGYQIHDYEDFQPTKEQVLAERAKKRAAGQAGGKASAKARASRSAEAPAQAKSKPVPVPDPVPDKTPPTPPQVGGRKPSLRSQGENPRAVAARVEAEKLQIELRECEICGDSGWNCTRCQRRLQQLEAVSA